MENIIYKEEPYLVIGKCMEVHSVLAHDFSEIVKVSGNKLGLLVNFGRGKLGYKRHVL